MARNFLMYLEGTLYQLTSLVTQKGGLLGLLHEEN
jgi:hypothetical protein